MSGDSDEEKVARFLAENGARVLPSANAKGTDPTAKNRVRHADVMLSNLVRGGGLVGVMKREKAKHARRNLPSA